MGEPTPTRTARTYGRRGVLARLLGGLLGAAVILLATPSGAHADVIIVNVNFSGSQEVGQNTSLFATLNGQDCTSVEVTFSFVGGTEEKSAKPLAADDADVCLATTTLRIPGLASCKSGAQRTVTAVASIAAGSVPFPMTVVCPTVVASSSSPPKNPEPTKSPPPKSPTATPTPTDSSVAASSGSAGPPAGSSPAKGEIVKPGKDAPTVARQALLLVPVDDGGPQPPEPGDGRSTTQQLAALLLLAVGGAATALVWSRGATRAVVGGVVAGTLVLAAAPLVVPALTAGEVAESTTVRTRTVTAEQPVAPGTSETATASCPAGSVLVGGGVRTKGEGATAAVVSTSLPTAGGWTTTGKAPAAGGITLVAVAVCTTDTGVNTAPAASVAASLSHGDTARTQAKCADGAPLALGWSGANAPAVAGLPLRSGGTVISYGVQDDATSLTNLLCTSPGSTAWPVRTASDQVEIAAGASGEATATCTAGREAVGGGYVAAASVGGRVAPVTVTAAVPDGPTFSVQVTAAGTGSGVLLTAYALCLPVH